MEAYICDQCGKSVQRNGCIGWLRLEKIGIDDTGIGDRPLPADFCSPFCVIRELNERTGFKETDAS